MKWKSLNETSWTTHELFYIKCADMPTKYKQNNINADNYIIIMIIPVHT